MSLAREQRMIAAHLEPLGQTLEHARFWCITIDGLPCIG